MLQLLIEWGYPVQRKQLEAEQSPIASSPICIPKSPDIMKRMQSVFDVRVNPKALLSPSALNCYLDCPLKFYYKYVAGLAAPEEVSAEIDSAKFGSIFHYATEHIYKELTAHGKVISKDTLEALLQEEVKLQNYVDNGFKELFFHLPAVRASRIQRGTAHQFRRDSALHSTTASQRPAPRSLYLRGLRTTGHGGRRDTDAQGSHPLAHGGDYRPYGQQGQRAPHCGLQNGRQGRHPAQRRIVVHAWPQTFQLRIPDFPVCAPSYAGNCVNGMMTGR